MAVKRWGSALLVAMVLLAGCGGGDDAKSKASDSSSKSKSKSSSSKSSSSNSDSDPFPASDGTITGLQFTASICEQIATLSPPLRDLSNELTALAAKLQAGGEFTGPDNGRLLDVYDAFERVVDDAADEVGDGPDPDIPDGENVKETVARHLVLLSRAAATAAVSIDKLALGDKAGMGAAVQAWGTAAESALNELGADFSGPLNKVTDPSCVPIVNEFKAAAAGGD